MNENKRHERRVRLMTGLLLLVVFVSGAVVGGAVLRCGDQRMPEPGKLGPPLSFLGLSKEQETKALQVLARERPRIEAVLKEIMPKIRASHDRVEEEIRTFLTPRQKWLLDKIKKYAPRPPMPGDPGRGASQ